MSTATLSPPSERRAQRTDDAAEVQPEDSIPPIDSAGGGGDNDSDGGDGDGGDGDGWEGDGEDDAIASRPVTFRVPTPIGSQRALQVVLGCFWILDAALQYQPFMFGNQFVPTYISANATGQPEPVSWLITQAGHFISPDIGVWNALFATVQLVIGVGLLFPRCVRPALITSFLWVAGVWFFGEGLGGLFTGTASALTGAPGSVLLYGLLGLMAWPRSGRSSHDTELVDTGLESCAAAHGLGGRTTVLTVWSGFWLLAAVLFLLPANRVASSVSAAISGMADGQPGWYARFLKQVGQGFGSAGVTQTWVLAILCVVIGLGPLLVRRYEGFLGLGVLLSVAFWLTSQGAGGILTGSGTDPNTAPLVILLALSMLPREVARPTSWSPPISRLVRRHPALFGAGTVGVFCALLLAATYPAGAQPSGGSNSMAGMTMSDATGSSTSSGSSMSGMSGMSGMTGMSTGSQTGKTAHCSGPGQHGLNITNSPNMKMGNLPGTTMNMNGADASAAAGLNATTSNWTYTGPALPSAEATELLTDGVNGPLDIHMAVSGCAGEPTFSEEIRAFSYVQTTSKAAAKYPTPASAVAAGYQLVSVAGYPVTYYVNPKTVSANEAAKRTLDPDALDGLVYAETPDGYQVLAAAMYVLPNSISPPPMPYGPLVQWHQRTNLCASSTLNESISLSIAGVQPCAVGTVQRRTPNLTMVWQLPVAGGPLAIQPPDIQIVEAAIMASAS